MTFWGVYHLDDPAESDMMFPTKKAREDYIREMYEPNDEGVQRREITRKGRLTKGMACSLYQCALR